MKIICLQENLKENMIILERFCSKNQTTPVLGSVLLKAQKGILKLFTTDLEVGVEIQVSCKVEKEGEVVVPIKLLTQFIQNLPNIKIIIEEKNKNIFIEADDFKTRIPTTQKDEFPLIPKIKQEHDLEINPEALQKGIQQVVNAVAVTHTISEISGILFDARPDILKITATDSFRLAEKTVYQKNNYKLTKKIKFIIPQKIGQELLKIIQQTEPILCYLEQNQIFFKLKNSLIVSRLLGGEYPNYEQIVPKSSKTKITLNKNEFASKIKLASIFSSKINDVRIAANVAKKTLTLYATDPGKGDFESTIHADMQGESVEALFNHKYLLDGLANILEDELLFELNGPSSPAIFKPKADTYFYIIMPIKT